MSIISLMNITKKIAISTIITSILAWMILEGIGLLINMALRPKMNITLLIMLVVGLAILITSYTIDNIRKNHQKKFKLILYILVEFLFIILMVFICYMFFINIPLETVVDEGLKIETLTDSFITSDYNLFYYRH